MESSRGRVPGGELMKGKAGDERAKTRFSLKSYEMQECKLRFHSLYYYYPPYAMGKMGNSPANSTLIHTQTAP